MPDGITLFSLLQKAKPHWSSQDLYKVHDKLQKVAITDAESLGRAVADNSLNSALASVGQRRFKSSTLSQLHILTRSHHRVGQLNQERTSVTGVRRCYCGGCLLGNPTCQPKGQCKQLASPWASDAGAQVIKSKSRRCAGDTESGEPQGQLPPYMQGINTMAAGADAARSRASTLKRLGESIATGDSYDRGHMARISSEPCLPQQSRRAEQESKRGQDFRGIQRDVQRNPQLGFDSAHSLDLGGHDAQTRSESSETGINLTPRPSRANLLQYMPTPTTGMRRDDDSLQKLLARAECQLKSGKCRRPKQPAIVAVVAEDDEMDVDSLEVQQAGYEATSSRAPANPTTTALEARLIAALQLSQRRNAQLVVLPTACVRVMVPCADLAHGWDLKEQLSLEISGALGPWSVDPEHVAVTFAEEALQCDVSIHGSASVLAIVEALTNALQDEGAVHGIEAAFDQAGVPVGATAQISPVWPLDRLCMEVELEHGYQLDIAHLESLVPAVTNCYEAMSSSWDHVLGDLSSADATALQALLGMESLYRVEGELSPLLESIVLEDTFRQGAQALVDLMADAAQAHAQLKARLAPTTEWSLAKVSKATEQCAWRSSADDSIPHGTHHDLGLKSDTLVLDEARNLMHPLDEEAATDAVGGLSCLHIEFDSPSCLRKSLDWIMRNFEIAWMENRFRNPPCSGYRDVSVGIRQHICTRRATPRLHVSELKLSLKELRDANTREDSQLRETVGSMLSQSGVKDSDIDAVVRTLLRGLDTTDAMVTRLAAQDLRYTAQCLEAASPSMSEFAQRVAVDLIRESETHAVAAAVPNSEILRAIEQGRLIAQTQAVSPRLRCASGQSVYRSEDGASAGSVERVDWNTSESFTCGIISNGYETGEHVLFDGLACLRNADAKGGKAAKGKRVRPVEKPVEQVARPPRPRQRDPQNVPKLVRESPKAVPAGGHSRIPRTQKQIIRVYG